MISTGRLGHLIAMASIGMMAQVPANPMKDDYPSISVVPTNTGGASSKRIRTGKTYPHSSERQRARYARQIAAGQIRNA
jgi:hypothetical protein